MTLEQRVELLEKEVAALKLEILRLLKSKKINFNFKHSPLNKW